jgi:amidase
MSRRMKALGLFSDREPPHVEIGDRHMRRFVATKRTTGFRAKAAILLIAVALPTQASAQDIDVVELTTQDIAAGYAAGDFTAVELTKAFLARIARYESHYNAFISMNPDALAIAEALDVEYAGSGPRGHLHGVPVVIKDNIDYGGLVTTAGWEGFNTAAGGVDMVPDDDAAVVTRLREAGAIILGKTNLPDFAGHGTRTNSTVEGQTLNPYNVTKVPGGSSGGTATSVNASFAVLGLGTETGGSIQNPASAQGLVGVKPTYGLVPIEGVVPLSGTYVDVVGPLAKTVFDAAVALDVLAGPTTEDLATFASDGHMPENGYVAALDETSLDGKRFGLVGIGWRDDYLPLDPLTEVQYRDAVELLESLGAEVVEDPFAGTGFVEQYDERTGVRSQGTHDMFVYLQGLGPNAPFNTIQEWEALSGREYTRGRGGRGGGEGRPPVPARPSATEEGDAYQAWRFRIRNLFRSVLEENNLDGLFFPQAGVPNRNIVEDPERPDFAPNNWAEIPSNIVNDLGVPTVTVPFSYFEDETPFVLAFIGDMWTEAELLAYAYAFEMAAGARVAPELTANPGG